MGEEKQLFKIHFDMAWNEFLAKGAAADDKDLNINDFVDTSCKLEYRQA